MSTTPQKSNAIMAKKVVKIVFFSLVLDLLAFTIPLPLFPRIIESFMTSEQSQSSLLKSNPSLLSSTLSVIADFRSSLLSLRPNSHHISAAQARKYDLVLLGGLLGSLFSFCQYIVSPFIGQLSDRFGRRKILLATLGGNLLSAVLWIFATDYGTYLASRAVGGLSEGNVQLALSIIADVSDESSRSKAMALVGVAFSVCFTLGPSLGAWFASREGKEGFGDSATWLGVGVNAYAGPAALSLVLLLLETLYLFVSLPETRAARPPPTTKSSASSPSKSDGLRNKYIASLGKLHMAFLFLFSGAEFTLTFLTYDIFSFTSRQNGLLLSFIGILSSLLQGGYTRRSKRPPHAFVLSGIFSSAVSLGLLSALPLYRKQWILYAAATCLAYTSATVVNSLNTLASLSARAEQRGEVMGTFRSRGQLGRALGPICATIGYWAVEPTAVYGVWAVGMLAVWMAGQRAFVGRVGGGAGAADYVSKDK